MSKLWVLVVALLLAVWPGQAQFDAATVLGTIQDATGAVISGSKITLENVQTGVKTEATTNANGNYEIFNVRIGRYTLRAEAAGFQAALAEEFPVTVSARQRVNLTLQVGQANQTVVVSEAAALVESESSDRGQVITQQAIVNLPLNGRAYADLALLAPGVRRSALSNQSAANRDASFNVNGLRSSLNNFVVDGVDNNAYGTSNQGFSNQVVQVTPDAVQEFRVQTNNYSAEYGRAGGAVINATTRSGTNSFHGAAWNYLRNTSLNAIGPFQPLGGVKPVFIQNQFGGAFGGPIKKDTMFFFADYEGLRRVSRLLRYATLPTADQRQGIFRGLNGTPISIRNPLTGVEYSNGILPQSDITAFARGTFGDLPLPNRPGVANNFESLPRTTINDDKGDVRYDHYISQRITAFVRYSHRELNYFQPAAVPGPSGGDDNGNTRVMNQQIAPGATFTLSPTSVLEARLGVSLTEAGKTPIGVGLPTLQERYGLTGLPTDTSIAGGLNTQDFNGISTLGRQPSNPQFQNPFVVNPKLNYSRIVGRHSVKTGYEYQSINTEIDDFNPKYGRDTYQGQFSSTDVTLAGVTTAERQQAYSIADFLVGARSRYELNNAAIANYRQRMHFGYVQDDWKVNTKLTLNLGMRYEFATPQWERDNRLSNYDPVTNSLISAREGSIEDRATVRPDRNNWAPRVGLAYAATSRTAIRSGYGMSYIHFNRMGGENLLAFNGPFVVGTVIDQDPRTRTLCPVGTDSTACFRPTQQGYPAGLVAPERYNPLTARVNYIPRNLPTGYVQSWHFTVQQALAENLVLDVAYVGNRGVNLMILSDYNQARPNAATENSSLQVRRPLQNFSFIQAATGGGFSTYHALQAKIEKRYSAGLYLLNSFTWSKAIDNAAGHLETANGDNSRVNIRNLPSEKGLSSYDQPFNNTTSVVWELPYGRGRRFGSTAPGVVDGVLGGWRMTAINTATSGPTINLTYNPASTAQVSTVLAVRPNVLGDVMLPSEQRSTTNYFNRANVVAPTDRSQPFGNAGRNIARGYSLHQLDLGLHKAFPLGSETRNLEFRAEAFNILNRSNFGTANGNVSSTAFGTVTTNSPARQIQFALKLVF